MYCLSVLAHERFLIKPSHLDVWRLPIQDPEKFKVVTVKAVPGGVKERNTSAAAGTISSGCWCPWEARLSPHHTVLSLPLPLDTVMWLV